MNTIYDHSMGWSNAFNRSTVNFVKMGLISIYPHTILLISFHFYFNMSFVMFILIGQFVAVVVL